MRAIAAILVEDIVGVVQTAQSAHGMEGKQEVGLTRKFLFDQLRQVLVNADAALGEIHVEELAEEVLVPSRIVEQFADETTSELANI